MGAAMQMMQDMNPADITWRTDDITMADIRRHWGDEFVDGILALHHADEHCRSRAVGQWDANQREAYAFYRSLARHIRENTAR